MKKFSLRSKVSLNKNHIALAITIRNAPGFTYLSSPTISSQGIP